MNIRGHGNGVAIALAGLAVVLASTGTAYAVAATTVNIADPTNPSRVAKVDASGRLSTAGFITSLDIATTSFAANGSGDVFSSPTTATLAVTSFSVVGEQTLTATYNTYLFQVPVQTDGTCSSSITNRLLAVGQVSPGSPGGEAFPAPIVVKPIGTARYCLDLYYYAGGSSPGPNDFFGVQVAGFVVSGTYTGIGVPGPTPDRTVPKSAYVR